LQVHIIDDEHVLGRQSSDVDAVLQPVDGLGAAGEHRVQVVEQVGLARAGRADDECTDRGWCGEDALDVGARRPGCGEQLRYGHVPHPPFSCSTTEMAWESMPKGTEIPDCRVQTR